MGFYSTTEFVPETSVGYLARRVNQLAQQGLEPVFAAEELTYIQWLALVSIYFGRGHTCLALARELAYDKGATTRLVDSLETRGWVRRERLHEDRRMVALALTPAGEARARDVREKVVARWNEWIGEWPAAEVAEALGVLTRLRDTLEQKIEARSPEAKAA